MPKIKYLRSDNTYIISSDSTDNPKLGAKKLSDGRESLFLDYYFGYQQTTSKNGKEYKKVHSKREYLKLYLWQAPRTPLERNQNNETIELAKKLRFERGQKLLENAEGYRLAKNNKNTNILEYFQNYIDGYKKKDIKMIKLALSRFKDFLQETPEYNQFSFNIKPNQLSNDLIADFADYLQTRSTGEGAKSIYQRFKKVLRHALEHDVLLKDPCKGIVIKADSQQLRKDILSPEEVQKLIITHFKGENTEVRRAFIFCLHCGLRFCDVKDLTFSNVDYSNKLLSFEQNKTKGHSASSGVVIPLNNSIINLIGKPQNANDRNTPIFNLPSYNYCSRTLKKWVTEAEINKHITWHCGRHSFAVNILNNGANIKTVANLLGHSGLAHTEKYTRAVDSLKQEAINSLDFGI